MAGARVVATTRTRRYGVIASAARDAKYTTLDETTPALNAHVHNRSGLGAVTWRVAHSSSRT